jgi:predicted nucleic acid-binding protein
LVTLLLPEARTARMRKRLEDDPFITTWAWTRVELASAIERLSREGRLSALDRRACLDQIAQMASNWDEVFDVPAVRSRAIALLARHPLRAADAAHLGAALWVAGDDPAAMEFVCLDDRLNRAAEREGLLVRQ